MYTHEFVFFSSKPQEVPALFSLLRPFPPEVWLSIAGAKVTLTVMHYITSYFTNRSKHHLIQIDVKRILVLMSLFSGFMFGHLYSKSFLSSLIAKEFEQPINTIHDLLASMLTMYYPATTAIAKYLADDKSKEMEQIMKHQGATFPFVGGIPPWVKDKSVIWKMHLISNNCSHMHFRVLNRQAVVVLSKLTGQKPYYHTSAEIIHQPLHSMVVPKQSPLEVRNNKQRYMLTLYCILNLF